MNDQARFLFDECVPKPSMIELAKMLLPARPEFAHICDKLTSGILDNDRVPQISKEGGWIIITGDRGKRQSLGGKLPDLCREHKVTHVIFSSGLHKRRFSKRQRHCWQYGQT